MRITKRPRRRRYRANDREISRFADRLPVNFYETKESPLNTKRAFPSGVTAGLRGERLQLQSPSVPCKNSSRSSATEMAQQNSQLIFRLYHFRLVGDSVYRIVSASPASIPLSVLSLSLLSRLAFIIVFIRTWRSFVLCQSHGRGLSFRCSCVRIISTRREDRVAKGCYRASHCERAPGAGVY